MRSASAPIVRIKDLRPHEIVDREFPLLARAARWTGGIANQNRSTLGGNIVNALPAADSLPARLVYEAELILSPRAASVASVIWTFTRVTSRLYWRQMN